MYEQRSLYDGVKQEAFVDSSFVPVPDEVSRAALSGSSVDFYRACRDTGYVPVEDYLTERYKQGKFEDEEERGLISSKLENAVSLVESKPSLNKSRKKGGRRTKIDYDVFGRELMNAMATTRGINIENIFADTETKRRIFRLAGYTHLNGSDNERVTLESAKPSRVGEAFKRTYNTWQKRDFT